VTRYRGFDRVNRVRRMRKFETDQRRHALEADVTTMSDMDLSASIYRVQTYRTRDLGFPAERHPAYATMTARIQALVDEQTRRRS
jgi:hypothetical protein